MSAYMCRLHANHFQSPSQVYVWVRCPALWPNSKLILQTQGSHREHLGFLKTSSANESGTEKYLVQAAQEQVVQSLIANNHSTAVALNEPALLTVCSHLTELR